MAEQARRPINVKLSPEARAGFQAFCDLHDISLAALLEAIGLTLQDGLRREPPEVGEVVDRARAIDEERARRPGPRRRRYNI